MKLDEENKCLEIVLSNNLIAINSGNVKAISRKLSSRNGGFLALAEVEKECAEILSIKKIKNTMRHHDSKAVVCVTGASCFGCSRSHRTLKGAVFWRLLDIKRIKNNMFSTDSYFQNVRCFIRPCESHADVGAFHITKKGKSLGKSEFNSDYECLLYQENILKNIPLIYSEDEELKRSFNFKYRFGIFAESENAMQKAIYYLFKWSFNHIHDYARRKFAYHNIAELSNSPMLEGIIECIYLGRSIDKTYKPEISL